MFNTGPLITAEPLIKPLLIHYNSNTSTIGHVHRFEPTFTIQSKRQDQDRKLFIPLYECELEFELELELECEWEFEIFYYMYGLLISLIPHSFFQVVFRYIFDFSIKIMNKKKIMQVVVLLYLYTFSLLLPFLLSLYWLSSRRMLCFRYSPNRGEMFKIGKWLVLVIRALFPVWSISRKAETTPYTYYNLVLQLFLSLCIYYTVSAIMRF